MGAGPHEVETPALSSSSGGLRQLVCLRLEFDRMKDQKPVEIICAACGQDTLLKREPKYDGFTRVGDTLTCASCGHLYENEESVPFKGRTDIKVFTDEDRSAEVKVFNEDEKGRICRHCVSYIVNPFTQWCAYHKKEVEATDTCDRFTPKPPPKKEAI
jgi:hypothetical protein